MNYARFASVTALLLFVLSACLPIQLGSRPEVVILNGPRAAFVLEAGATLQRLAGEGALPFRAVGNTTARFLESSRGISGASASAAAASVADQLGAKVAVMVGVPVRERTVATDPERGVRRVDITIRLEVLVVRAEDGAVVATVRSRSYSGQRDEPLDAPLVALDHDPTVAALAAFAADESATAVFEAVAAALGQP
jgi:hypothetical protein